MKKLFGLSILIVVLGIFGTNVIPTTLDSLSLNAGALVNKAINPQTTLKLVFSDEFNGSTLNTNKWATQLQWGRTNPPELEYYSPTALTVANGALHIKAQKKLTNGKPYTSGVIATYKSFKFTYGIVVARIRIPAGKGMWPALWLLDYAWGPSEIDITEMVGYQPSVSYMTLHYQDADGQMYTPGTYYKGPNFSTGYHIFKVDWTPAAITWYIDGVQRYRTTQHIPNKPMYLIANLAVGGVWPGSPDSTTKFPAYYHIDYIRIYKRQ
jgi:beta-glucanase (GH16 family)